MGFRTVVMLSNDMCHQWSVDAQDGDCTCGATGNTVHSERCPVTHMVRAAFAASGESATAVAGEVGEREGPTGDQLRAIIKNVGSIGTNHADAPTEYVLAGWQAALASNKAAAVAARPTDDVLWDQTLTERDNYHEWADKLANAIAEHFGVEIGEHSSANNPWSVALEALEDMVEPIAHAWRTTEPSVCAGSLNR